MSFLGDLLMVFLVIVYFRLNQKLYKWRLVITEKYPRAPYKDKTLRADIRGMWEFMVSVLLITGLYAGWLIACSVPVRMGAHTIIQWIIIPGALYWFYTFTFVATYPASYQFTRWLSKKLLNKYSA